MDLRLEEVNLFNDARSAGGRRAADRRFNPERDTLTVSVPATCSTCPERETCPERSSYAEDDGCGDVETEVDVPAIFEVCPTCQGRGKHVNPEIDASGLSREDFEDDPDFARDYWAGAYDVPCMECSGLRVVPVPDPARMSPAVRKALQDDARRRADYAAERAAELRWGA